MYHSFIKELSPTDIIEISRNYECGLKPEIKVFF